MQINAKKEYLLLYNAPQQNFNHVSFSNEKVKDYNIFHGYSNFKQNENVKDYKICMDLKTIKKFGCSQLPDPRKNTNIHTYR